MKRFRLFRSRAFWFGVPGLVGLLWGWWVSMGYWSEAGFMGGHPFGLGQVNGEIFPFWDSAGWPDRRVFEVSHQKASRDEVRRWKMALATWRERDPSYSIVFIPYYLPVTGYVAGWAGLLIWRKRKFEKPPVE